MADVDKKKEETYDRQLRLWGAHGQKALENAKVCLINAGATGTEILKNLVLPGVGSYTILDGNKVVEADLGNNFFLEAASLGSSRAQCATRLLQELNGWVSGLAVEEDPVQVVKEKIDFFSKFTLVIATELPEPALLALSDYLYKAQIPLFVVRSYGFVGYFRIVAGEHTIVESHPEEPEEDLRLGDPFPALSAFAESVDLSKLDSHLHSHVPYVVLLLQAARKWTLEHGGALPSSREEKNQFKLQVREGANDAGESNFLEAIAQAYRVSSPTSLNSYVRDILGDSAATNLTEKSSSFWVLVAALREFVAANNGLPPVIGSIPDMTADTHSFLALQQVYQRKAQEDIQAVTDTVVAILKKLGRAPDAISADEIKLFCKSAQSLRLVRTRPLAQEYAKDTADVELLKSTLEETPNNGVFYILLRAVDRFFVQHGRYPGWTDQQVEGDIALLKIHVDALLGELGLDSGSVSEDSVHEICRFGASEMHNIAAFLGGVVAQEAIKILTHQWVPLNNTLIYNGMNSTTTTLAL